jgi:hypothetical protein
MSLAIHAPALLIVAKRLAGKQNKTSVAGWQRQRSVADVMQPISRWRTTCTSRHAPFASGDTSRRTSPSCEAVHRVVSPSIDVSK